MIAENNSCFGVLNKLKFSITSVCLRPIFLNFFTNLLLKFCFSLPFGLFFNFEHTIPKILTSVLDLQCHARSSFKQFQSMPHSGAFNVILVC